jgi:Arc/MetJ-type ribon-helix-helix transcriptional regulator
MAQSETLTITINSEQAKLIQDKLDSGEYGSVDEIVATALGLMEDDTPWLPKDTELQGLLEAAVNDPRPTVSIDEAFSTVREHIAKSGSKAKRAS